MSLEGKFRGAKFETVNGNIKVEITSPQTKKVDVETANGNVKISLAEELGLEANLETSLGSLHFDETIFEVIKQRKDLTERTAVICKQKEFMPQVVAETTTGNIHVNQLQSKTDSKKEG